MRAWEPDDGRSVGPGRAEENPPVGEAPPRSRLLHLRRSFLFLALLSPGGLLQGCALAGGRPAEPPPAPSPEPSAFPPGWTETGIASWYGRPFHGRRTASGEVYDMNELTAAHPILPFGTRIRVENLDNGRSATVRINDRGPFVDDRVLDLSRKAAEVLGVLGPGTARVLITVLGGESRRLPGSRLFLLGPPPWTLLSSSF